MTDPETTSPETEAPSTGRRISWRPLAIAACFPMLAGMLFWAKLKLVSDVPRTVYAVPKERADETADQPQEPAAAPGDGAATDQRDEDQTP